MKDSKDDVHLKYFVSALTPRAEFPEADDDSEFDSEPNEADFLPLHDGFYQLSLERAKLPDRSDRGWTVGRGRQARPEGLGRRASATIEVDFLLAKPHDPLSRRIAPVHFLLQIHRRSGALLVTAASDALPLEYQEGGVWHKLAYREKRVICQPSMLLRLDRDCEFEFKITVLEGAEASYFEDLVAHIEDVYVGGPEPRVVRFLPGTNAAVFRKHSTMISPITLGHGAFGWVKEAVALDTGEPLAVKAFQIRNSSQRQEIAAEYCIGREVKMSGPNPFAIEASLSGI